MDNYVFNTDEIRAQALEFLRSNNIEPVDSYIYIDGQLHRYKLHGDKTGQKSGAYCFFSDNWPAGWAMSWKTGKNSVLTWAFARDKLDGDGKSYFSDEKYQAAIRLSKQHQAKLQAQREAERAEASDKARVIAETLPKAPLIHKYLVKKNVETHGNMRYDEEQNALVLPLTDIDGNVQSLQYIHEDGSKRFYQGAATKGAFFGISLEYLDNDKDNKIPILIAEGYATAATVHELTNMPVIAAMNCYNIAPVAEAFKKKYPHHKIIIMADNDAMTIGNPGLTHAREACKKLGLTDFIYPVFGDAYKELTDWNDFCRIEGEQRTAKALVEKIKFCCKSKERQSILGKVREIDAQTLRYKEFPPIKWAVEGFLPSGLSVLAGGPKVGKSILSLHLSLAVCTGGYAFGKIPVQQGDVLYLALEDTDRRLKERIIGSDIDDDIDISRLRLATYVPRQYEGGMEYIQDWLEENPEARLVIIDTLQKFRKQLSGKNSMYSEDYDVMSDIKKLADEFDVPILVIHHLKKAMAEDWLNEISGSQGIAGAADTIFALKRARTENGGILHRTGRDVEEADFAMELDGYGWVLKGDAELFTMPQWKKQILDYLREHNSVTPMELSEALHLKISTAKTNLNRLKSEGLITRAGYGRYTLKETLR